MFKEFEPPTTDPVRDDVALSIGRFIIEFGKVEFMMMRALMEINRIVDGTTISKKMPYGIGEVCVFLKKAAPFFTEQIEAARLEEIAIEIEALNDVRSTLVHSYQFITRIEPEATWFEFDRFVRHPNARNARRFQKISYKKKYIDDATVDLERAKFWISNVFHEIQKLPVR